MSRCLIIARADHRIVAGPLDQRIDDETRYSVLAPPDWPARKRWSPPRRGFEVVPDTLVYDPATRTYVDVVVRVEAELLALVKAEAERRKMQLLTAGGAKKTEYSEKRAEVLAWDTLGSTPSAILVAFAALAPATRALRFEHALADAAAHGDQPANAIARFRAGLNRAATVATISAAEAVTCTRIKAAAGAAAKRAAAAAVVWP